MRISSILTPIALLLSTFAFSQPITLQVSGGVNHLVNQDYSNVNQTTVFAIRPWYFEDDTFRISQQILANQFYKTHYIGKIGYSGALDVMIPISSRLFLSTGVGFNYSAYSFSDDYDIDFLDTLSTDTLPYTGSFLPDGVVSFECDCYENSYLDIRNQVQNPTVQALGLVIPLKMNFDLLPHRLSFNIGAFTQIPLWIAQKKTGVSIEQYESEGMTKCKYVVLNQVDLSGNGIRRMHVGFSAGVQLNLFNGFGLNLGVSKQLTNMYVGHEYQSAYAVKDYRPYQVNASVVYTFKQKAKAEY